MFLTPSYGQEITKWHDILNTTVYLALNHWLQKADTNYLEGRVLWFQSLIEGACNLLWLSIEQVLKILILQAKFETIDSICKGLGTVYKALDKEAKSISRKHSGIEIVRKVESTCGELNLAPYYSVMDKLEEYFNKRYVVPGGSTISLLLIHEVDELYFLLREHIAPELGLGLIDEIYIRRKHRWPQTMRAFDLAYYKNKSFRGRKHEPINQTGPDGITYVEDGTASIKVFHLGKT